MYVNREFSGLGEVVLTETELVALDNLKRDIGILSIEMDSPTSAGSAAARSFCDNAYEMCESCLYGDINFSQCITNLVGLYNNSDAGMDKSTLSEAQAVQWKSMGVYLSEYQGSTPEGKAKRMLLLAGGTFVGVVVLGKIIRRRRERRQQV